MKAQYNSLNVKLSNSQLNGIVEKHNDIVENMIEKVLSDVKFSLDVVLAWCLSAKDYLLLTHTDTVLINWCLVTILKFHHY